ncbi:conserved protein of unknown function [Modestobacter italicus]|uniref:Restriction endonuclease n=1 Tax=Modestobacter italicus (strain DSM 44449 / CECT 9708 / BC 501) TaxID=2732864 RepID=I4EQY9_MODI5|nr:conserved protein of unknown function [Modestobacter marinus]
MQEQWLARVQKLRRWSRDGQRAPHKPLLLLWMLAGFRPVAPGRSHSPSWRSPSASCSATSARAVASHHPEFPFPHLTNDGLWAMTDATGADARPLGTAVGRLRSAGAVGQLEPAFEAALPADPTLLAAAVRALLDANFPASLHEDLLARCGLALEPVEAAVAEAGRRRDTAFCAAVLVAYEGRCATCGFDDWLGGEVIGLDAAHVHWRAIGGPDSIDNALGLCTLHHRLFDRGVVGLADDGTVMVSQLFVGRARAAQAQVLSLAGAPLLSPQAGHPTVADTHRGWHTEQVFREPARLSA